MIFTPEQANAVFDIIVEKGNFSSIISRNTSERYIAGMREEFVHNATTRGLNEYWFPTSGSSNIKLYFTNYYGRFEVNVYAQSLNVKEKHIVPDMKEAFAALTV